MTMPGQWEPSQALELIHEIQAGSVAAWHRFVDGYSSVVHGVVHRYLAFAGIDDRRDLFVSILEKLRQGALYRYDGRCRLSTWLFIFARSRCLDHLRSKHGRRSLPPWLQKLPAVERRVFRLYYVDGMSPGEIRAILLHEGSPMSLDQLAASLERLEQRLDTRMRKRLAYDLLAESVGVASGRLLDFLHRLKIEYDLQAEHSTPEQVQLQQEVARAAEQVRMSAACRSSNARLSPCATTKDAPPAKPLASSAWTASARCTRSRVERSAG